MYETFTTYPLFEVFWPGGTRISTASLKISFRSSAVAEKGRFFTNSVRASFSVGHMSVSARVQEQNYFPPTKKCFNSWHHYLFCCLASLLCCGPFPVSLPGPWLFCRWAPGPSAGPPQMQSPHSQISCRVKNASNIRQCRLQWIQVSQTSFFFLILAIKQGCCHAIYNDRILISYHKFSC